MSSVLPKSPLTAALAMLPAHIAEAISAAAGLYGGRCDEIRLCRGGQVYMCVRGENIRTSVICTDLDISETVKALCGNSLYAHSDTIRQGFIFTASGFRVGVCGRAVCRGESVELVSDITSLVIRVPMRYPGAADDLYPYVTSSVKPQGMLIWSAPGVGKTTALRELSVLLTGGGHPYRVSVIDTRFELMAGISDGTADVFRGYPRAVGMEIAVRTMSPQIVVCDEIAGQEDADAVRACAASGIAIIASAHAEDFRALQMRRELRSLIEENIFPTVVGLYRRGGEVCHHITNAAGEVLTCCG